MTGSEGGFLLLTSRLGVPDRKPLTPPQLRKLTQAMAGANFQNRDDELTAADLREMGISEALSEKVLTLLSQQELLQHYLSRAARAGCTPITRGSGAYPPLLRRRLGPESPGCLWAKGEKSLLSLPAIALVGSRDLRAENLAFAQAVGRQAARQSLVLVSGNARGADRAAQEACLASGGRVISIVADELENHPQDAHILYLSEDGFDAPFSAYRALSRNRCIHSLGLITFVAQARLNQGGTWKGTEENLKRGWSNVAVFRDGSRAALELEQLGAVFVTEEDLEDLSGLSRQQLSLFDEQEDFP